MVGRVGLEPTNPKELIYSQPPLPLGYLPMFGRERETRTHTPDFSRYWDLSRILPYQLGLVLYFGASGVIRTLDPLIKSQVLYTAELQTHNGTATRDRTQV